MKDTIKVLKHIIYILFFVLVLYSCTSTSNEKSSEPVNPTWPMDSYGNPVKKLAMSFNGSAPSFESSVGSQWLSGDIVYIRLDNGAIATGCYEAGSWTFELISGKPSIRGTCVIRYFANATSKNANAASLDYRSIDFLASNGTYYYDATNNRVVVGGTFAPNCARVRFKGNVGESIVIKGVNIENKYSFGSDELSSSVTPITISVGSDGYTPYVYGTLNKDSRIWVVDNDIYWTRLYGSDDLSIAQTAVMDIPTTKNRQEWRLYEYPFMWPYDVTAEQQKIIRELYRNMVVVEHGEFNSYNRNCHVTLTKDFLINKYELRQIDWTTIVGTAQPWWNAVGVGDNYPCYIIDPVLFLERLNYLSGMVFRLPTETEWEFAARGGNKSQNYYFSGSNNPGEVANFDVWTLPYAKIVGQFKPNELGLYDMSGNMQELTQDLYSEYYFFGDSVLVDPVNIKRGAGFTARGGYYQSTSVSEITLGARTQSYGGDSRSTIRIAITASAIEKY